MTDEFKAAVGLSRKWDAREAGREAAAGLLESLGNVPPSFVILICTNHYSAGDGYKKLLYSIKEVLPDSILIGGVMSGFMVPQGVFARGVAIAGISYKNMDVAVAVGKNTKKNPRKAARDCADKLKRDLSGSKYPNGLLFEFTSGPLIPQIPGMSKKVIDSELLAKIMILSQNTLSKLQFGMGREEDVRDELAKQLPDFSMIGNSTFDANKFMVHRQFLQENVYSNSIVALAIKTDLSFFLKTGLGFKKTEKKFEVTKISGFGNIVDEINGKPACEEYVRIQGWNPKDINEGLIKRTYFVLPAFEKNGQIFPEVIGFVYGSHIFMSRKIENPHMMMLTASGKSLIGAVDEATEDFSGEPKFIFVSSCHARFEALGSNTYRTRDKLLNRFKNTPFLLGFGGGEHIYQKNEGSRHRHESFNIGIIH